MIKIIFTTIVISTVLTSEIVQSDPISKKEMFLERRKYYDTDRIKEENKMLIQKKN